jgi:excisionase family DNA binding protein
MPRPAAIDEPLKIISRVKGELMVNPAYEFLSCAEVAAILEVRSVRVVYRLITEGCLRAVRNGHRGPWRISVDAMMAYLEQQRLRWEVDAAKAEAERLADERKSIGWANTMVARRLRRRVRLNARISPLKRTKFYPSSRLGQLP